MRAVFQYGLVLGTLLGACTNEASAALLAQEVPLEVIEHTLDNGLRLLIAPRPTSPTAAFVVQYGVGGVNEGRGSTGIAHLLEHLLFKGTTSIGTRDAGAEQLLLDRMDAVHDTLLAVRERSGDEAAQLQVRLRALEDSARAYVVTNEFDRTLASHGSRGLNATTGAETTTYFVELPANRTQLWMMLEGDRMRDPVFREFYTERDVVMEERRTRVEDDPGGLLYETHMATSFDVHPYGQPVVGWMEDLRRLGRPQVREYFRRYYGARNAVVAIVGDVQPDSVLAWAERYLGPVPAGEPPPPVLAVEPEQRGERRVVVVHSGTPRLRMGWHTVENAHPDAAALFMLSATLTGGRSARLQRRLVQEERAATFVSSGTSPGGRYPGLFTVDALPGPGVAPDRIESMIDEELERLADTGPDEEELERIRNQLQAAEVRRLTSNLGLAMELASGETGAGSWQAGFAMLERMRAVGVEDVRRVAGTYFKARNRTVATLSPPDSAAARAAPSPAPMDAAVGATPSATDPEQPVPANPLRERLRAFRPPPLRFEAPQPREESVGGVPVVYLGDPSLPLVDIVFRFRGGYALYDRRDYAPITALPALMRNGGTVRLPPDSFEAQVDRIALQGSVGGGGESVVASLNTLTGALPQALALWVEMLRTPRFDSTEVESWRRQQAADIARRPDSPTRLAYSEFNRLMYGDHPIGWEMDAADLERLTMDALRRVHTRIVCRENLSIGVSGDVRWDALAPVLDSLLAGWPSCSEAPPAPLSPVVRASGGVFLIPRDIDQATVVIGQPSPVRLGPSPNFFAAQVGNSILGAGGFSSRLMTRLRTETGLAYSVSSLWTAPSLSDGLLGAVTQVRAEVTGEAIELLLFTLQEMSEREPAQAEVASAIGKISEGFVFAFQTPGQVVARRMGYRAQALPDDWLEQFVEGIQDVTPAAVLRAFQATHRREAITILVVGDPARIGSALERFGPVTLLDEQGRPRGPGR